MQRLSIKRGDTFYAECQLVDAFGTGKAIAGMTIAASLIDRGGNLAHTFSVQIINEPEGMFALNATDTAPLPPALYVLQLQYTLTSADNFVVGCQPVELLIADQINEASRAAVLASALGKTRILLTTQHAPATTVWSETWAD